MYRYDNTDTADFDELASDGVESPSFDPFQTDAPAYATQGIPEDLVVGAADTPELKPLISYSARREGATPTTDTYSELQQSYDFFNQTLFEGQLPHCLITLQREKRSIAFFQGKTFVNRTGETTDELAMNPRYFATRSIRETLSSQVREMVHLWQLHFGTPSRKGYHNKEWGDQMARIGLMPSNTGRPGGKMVGEKMAHFIIAGGPFDVACTKLLTQEFTLSWMDRHPNVAPIDPVPPDAAEAAGMHLPSAEEIAEVEAAEKYVSLPEAVEPKRRRTDGSNRVKYRCPVCSTQAWGKPDLMILCGVVQCGGAKFEPPTAAELTPVFAPTPRPF